MNPTQLQQSIIDECLNGNGNILVEAGPGSGKSSSLKLATDAILRQNPNNKILALSYTNSIKQALIEKLDARCHVLSIHQMGLSLLNMSNKGGKFRFDARLHDKKTGNIEQKYRLHLEECIFPDFPRSQYNVAYEYIKICFDLVNKMRLELCDFDNEHEYYRIAEKYHIDGIDEQVIKYVQMALEMGIASYQAKGWNDFIDMLYLPIIFDVYPKKGMKLGNNSNGFILNSLNWLLVDEVQDCSPIIFELMSRFNKVFNCRLLCVGDEHQSLFAFASADTQSMQKLKVTFNCKPLPLNESFRCPEVHIDFLNTNFGTELLSRSGNIGNIETLEYHEIYKYINPGDMVLSRTNAESLSMFLTLLQLNIPARLVKFDLYDFFEELLEKIEKDNRDAWDNIYLSIANYEENEIQKYRKKMSKFRAEELIGELSANLGILRAYIEYAQATNSKDFLRKIQNMLDNTKRSEYVSIYNIHIAKGLENENVFILSANRLPWYREGMNDEDIQQEKNAFFVAASRSKENLYLVNEQDKPMSKSEKWD